MGPYHLYSVINGLDYAPTSGVQGFLSKSSAANIGPSFASNSRLCFRERVNTRQIPYLLLGLTDGRCRTIKVRSVTEAQCRSKHSRRFLRTELPYDNVKVHNTGKGRESRREQIQELVPED